MSDCKYCFHNDVCKYREDLQKEKQKLTEILENATLSQLEKLSVLSINIECSHYVSATDIMIKSSYQYLNQIPTVKLPYEITCQNQNVNTNAYSNKK